MAEHLSQKLGIDWLKTIAAALAAVSSAVLLSTLGAAGTIIGAALGSVIATVGGALYSQGLGRSRERLAQAQAIALGKVGIAQAEVRRASRNQGDDQTVDAHLTHAQERLREAKQDLDAVAGEDAGPGWRERFATLPWRQVSLLAAGLFVAAVLAITAFELVVGESVSSITGGTDGGGRTTITRIGGGSDDDTSQPDDEAPSDDGSSPTDEPTSEPSSEPSSESSDQASPTGEPTSESTESPSGSTTPLPTPTPPTSPSSTLPSEPTPTPPS